MKKWFWVITGEMLRSGSMAKRKQWGSFTPYCYATEEAARKEYELMTVTFCRIYRKVELHYTHMEEA